ncbi:MAG: MFS transporter [Halofilum sp. (in: g-proteobacteria)]|nr:MFS transporter [Halofilum sp. (in: g-proteobacteria)]
MTERTDDRSPARATGAVLPWGSFGPILAIHFLGTLGFSLAIPFLVFIVTDLGGAAWTYGLLGATYSAFQFLGAPLLGRWSDRAGRRPVLVASQVGTLTAWLLFLVALSLPLVGLGELAGATLTLPLLLVFLARALDGTTGGNISVANAYVADLTRDAPGLRQVAFGRMGMAASLGFVIGPAAAGLLGGTALGPRLPIAIAAVIAAVTTVAILRLLQEPPGRGPERPPLPGVVEAGLNQQARPCDRAPARRALRQCLTRGPVALILAATFVLFLGFNFFYAGFPIHAAGVYGWDVGRLGLFFALLSGLMIVAQGPLLALASHHLDRRVVFAIGTGFLALALLSLQGSSGALAFAGAACFALGNGLAWPTFQARVAELAGEAQGTVQGAVTSAGSLASIVGLVLGGLLYPALGGHLFLLAAGLFGLVLLLTPLWFPRTG